MDLHNFRPGVRVSMKLTGGQVIKGITCHSYDANGTKPAVKTDGGALIELDLHKAKFFTEEPLN